MVIDGTRCTNYNNYFCIETKAESRCLPSENYKLLIIGSYGEVSEFIQVAPKIIPGDQEGSNKWMTEEISLIKEKHEKSRYCNKSDVSVYSELPGKEQHSKDYYLKEIKEFLTNCKHNKGKEKHVCNNDTN